MTPDGIEKKVAGRQPERGGGATAGRSNWGRPWPIVAVAAFAAALYEAVSHNAPSWALAIVSLFAALQVAVLALWIVALYRNRRLERTED